MKLNDTFLWLPKVPLPPPKSLKAILLAAGKGTRLRPLTDTTPKPLLPLHDHPIMEYILDGISRAGVKEICLIVGYKAELIETWVNSEYLSQENIDQNPWRQDLQFNFILQEDINGTGGAVLLAKEWVGDSYCFVNYGDILMSWSVYERIVDTFQKNNLEWYLVGNPTEDASAGAAIYYHDYWIDNMIEKPPKTAPFSDLNNAGSYIFPPVIFELLENTPLSARGEIELTAPIIDRIHQLLSPFLIKMTQEEFWCDVGTIPVYDRLENSEDWLIQVKNTNNEI